MILDRTVLWREEMALVNMWIVSSRSYDIDKQTDVFAYHNRVFELFFCLLQGIIYRYIFLMNKSG